jgi:diguanylate cyclase (GGDEF)-like protein
MKNQPVLDSNTGLNNEVYLEPVLRREFGWARCYGKSLSLIKMHVDSFEELVNTYGKSRIKKVLQEAGKVLAENSRGGDIMISAGEGNFLILLPDTPEQGAGQIAQRIRKTLVTHMFPELENDCVRIIFGVAATPGKDIECPADLLAAASDALEKAQEQKDKAHTV